MTGRTPPIGEETPVTVSVSDVVVSRNGVFLYSRPVDIASFAISQESTPLPVEESQRPVILSRTSLPISVPAPPSIPYRLSELLASNPSSPSLRFDPVLLSPRSPSRGLMSLYPRVPN